MVSKGNLKIGELRNGAKIGVSSLRRKTQLKKYRDDLQIVDIRGAIEERLDKLDDGSGCFPTRHPEERSDEGSHEILQPFGLQDDPSGRNEKKNSPMGQLDKNGLDAIIVAACALMRLGLEYRITQRIPFQILKPHSLQGSLAIEVRAEDLDLIKFLSKIDSREILSV